MIYLLAVVFILSLILTGYLRHYALAKNLIDVPNHRSSHVVPTPRGGGLAFIIAFFVTISFISYLGFVAFPAYVSLLGAGLFIAVLGFLDDHGHIAPSFRLLGHLSASAFALYWLGGMPAISILGWSLSSGFLLNVMAIFYLAWLLNLYNFMDGIDGLAAIEALSVCCGGAFLYWLNGEYAFMGVPLALGAAVAGFLYWNFPPARIFMGDAGSGFLGLTLGLLSIQAATIKPAFFWCWLILLGVFIVDATITLLRRVFQPDCKVFEAHRSHAYQHAARYFGRHLSVTMSILAINILWLLPIAALVGCGYLEGTMGLFVAYIPLIILAFKFKAGKSD